MLQENPVVFAEGGQRSPSGGRTGWPALLCLEIASTGSLLAIAAVMYTLPQRPERIDPLSCLAYSLGLASLAVTFWSSAHRGTRLKERAAFGLAALAALPALAIPAALYSKGLLHPLILMPPAILLTAGAWLGRQRWLPIAVLMFCVFAVIARLPWSISSMSNVQLWRAFAVMLWALGGVPASLAIVLVVLGRRRPTSSAARLRWQAAALDAIFAATFAVMMFVIAQGVMPRVLEQHYLNAGRIPEFRNSGHTRLSY